MTTRIDLPPKRESVTQKAKIGKVKIYLTVGFYDESKQCPGELFVTVEGASSAERFLMDALARTTSIALQHGVKLDRLMEQWHGTKGETCGLVLHDDRVRFCSSILDYIAKHMLIWYCGRTDLDPTSKDKEEAV